MRILAFDLGKESAYNFQDEDININLSDSWTFTDLLDLRDKIDHAIKILLPIDVILVPYPTHYYSVIVKHAKMIGVIEMIAEDYNIPVFEVNDARCKKIVLKNGKAKKEEIMEYYKEKNEHIADCRMFIDWYLQESC